MSMQPWEVQYEQDNDIARLRKENKRLQAAIDGLNKETGEAMAAMNAEIERLRAAKVKALKVADERSAENVKLRQENERLTAALESCASWIDRWTNHVGACEGGEKCTCGRTAVLYEANSVLEQK